MKTLITSAFLALFALAPNLTSAQTLTRADVEQIAPSLNRALVTASVVVPNYVNTTNAAHNHLLSQYSKQLANFSATLSTGTPSPNYIENVSKTVSGMSAQVSAISEWRANLSSTISSMISIISEIRVGLSSVS